MPLSSTLRMAALALLWGSGFLWIKLALTHGLTPAQITIARCALGTAVLLLLARRAGQRLPRDRTTWSHLAIAALFCNALPFALFSLGEQTVDSGTAGVLNATTPLWSLLIGVLLGTDRAVTPVRLTGLLLGFAGTLLIFAPWHHEGLLTWGALALLTAAASYAVAFAYMARKLTTRDAPWPCRRPSSSWPRPGRPWRSPPPAHWPPTPPPSWPSRPWARWARASPSTSTTA